MATEQDLWLAGLGVDVDAVLKPLETMVPGASVVIGAVGELLSAAGRGAGVALAGNGAANGSSSGAPPPKPATALTPDEEFVRDMLGDDFLQSYQETKGNLAQAHEAYVKTGKILPTKSKLAPIEIKEGKLMSRAERYDAMVAGMLQKQGDPTKTNPQVDDVTQDNRDPDYLTKEEFHDEFWAREKKEYDACEDEYIRPGKIDKCQRAVDEKYGGESFKQWRDQREQELARQVQVVQEKIDGVANSGPLSLAGRAIGRAIGGEKGEEWGAAIGGMGDIGVGMYGMARGGEPGANGVETEPETAAHVAPPPENNPAETMPSSSHAAEPTGAQEPVPAGGGGAGGGGKGGGGGPPKTDIGRADTQPAPAKQPTPGRGTAADSQEPVNPRKPGELSDSEVAAENKRVAGYKSPRVPASPGDGEVVSVEHAARADGEIEGRGYRVRQSRFSSPHLAGLYGQEG